MLQESLLPNTYIMPHYLMLNVWRDRPRVVYNGALSVDFGKGRPYAISLGFQRRAAAMQSRVGIGLRVDPYHGLLSSDVEYQLPPSSDRDSDEEWRYVNIRNHTDLCMHRWNPVYVSVQLPPHWNSWYKLFCCCGVWHFVVWFLFLILFFNIFYNFITGTRQHKIIHTFFYNKI